MSTFVLIHASCHGGWSWKKLAPILRKSRHEVYTPTLTGLGERSHLVSKNVNLNTDIENALNTKISNPLYLPKIRLEVRPFDGCKL